MTTPNIGLQVAMGSGARGNPRKRQESRGEKVLEPEINAVGLRSLGGAAFPLGLAGAAAGSSVLGLPLAGAGAVTGVGAVKAGMRLQKAANTIDAALPKIDAAKAKNAALRRGKK